eukprot:550107-Hanusia_phi.AAC.2
MRAVLSECVHSIADFGNQCLLAVGIAQVRGRGEEEGQEGMCAEARGSLYGKRTRPIHTDMRRTGKSTLCCMRRLRERVRYVWSLISGVGIFFLGCGVSVYHGGSLSAPPSLLSGVQASPASFSRTRSKTS